VALGNHVENLIPDAVGTRRRFQRRNLGLIARAKLRDNSRRSFSFLPEGHVGQRFLDAFPVGRVREFGESVILTFATHSRLIVHGRAGRVYFPGQAHFRSVAPTARS
jgi:hypothetical protein